MAYDLLIKNGRIIDGSGLPAYHGDIGVAGGRIVEMGRLDGGRRVIDADGLAVAPGFIDIHTHYDAQVLWDPLLTCSPWHGTTTVIMGNCGFGIAPCAPAARDYLASMFAVVEGMDLVALNAGLDWAWESFPQYLDRVGRESLGLNVGALVGHSALRRYVMGEDGSRREADAGEIEAMTSLLREAMAAGAFGFSSSQTPNHLDAQGVLVASAFASRDELVGLAEVIAEFNVGGIEFISKTAVMGDDVFAQEDQDIMTAMSLASGRPVNWNELSQGSERPTVWRQQLDFMGRAAAAGAQVYAVARCQNMDRMFSLRDNTDFRRWSDTWPNWRDILGRPHAEKVAALASAEGRAALMRDFGGEPAAQAAVGRYSQGRVHPRQERSPRRSRQRAAAGDRAAARQASRRLPDRSLARRGLGGGLQLPGPPQHRQERRRGNPQVAVLDPRHLRRRCTFQPHERRVLHVVSAGTLGA